MDAEVWRQAKSVLEAALVCEPAERDALIAARCADPSLRREVHDLLNDYEESFLESALTLTNTFDQAAAVDEVEPPPDVHAGELIANRYEVKERLGAGGMGAVFRCYDPQLDRDVALKFLTASASAAEVQSRIRHEARAAARIKHANIATVYDVGDHDGRPFLAMEYVEGENLAQLLKRSRPPLEKILAIGRQLASALTAAHAKGIVHRDLKPANIQLTPDGSSAKILDFGIAHAMAVADAEPASSTTAASLPLSTIATLRTERGAIRHPGTPAYMSPEQMFGKPIDGRSDIYSLGVILYEMATGHRPYSTDDPLDVVLALSRNLLRPSGEETHLPEAVNDVIGKMLTVELDHRYQSAEEVESALTSLMAPEPAVAPTSRWMSALWAAARVAGTVAAAAAFISFLGYSETWAFNSSLGRSGTPFDDTGQAARWIFWGLRSLLLPTIYSLFFFLVLWGVKFVIRMLSLSKKVDRLLTNSAAQTHRIESRLNLDDPAVLGQAVLLAGALALSVVLWRYWAFVSAFMTASIDTVGAERFLALQPTRSPARSDAQGYQIWLAFLVTGFIVALGRIRQLRAIHPLRRVGAAFVPVSAMAAFAILLCVLPYRIEWISNMPRLEVAGERCYRIGERGDEWLIHCPDRQPPRNRTVKSTDPTVRDTGIQQGVFTPRETPH